MADDNVMYNIIIYLNFTHTSTIYSITWMDVDNPTNY